MTPERSRADELLALLRDGQVSAFLARAAALDPPDLADVLAVAEDDERVEIVKLLPPELSGQALWELPEEEHPADTLAALAPEQAAEIVEVLPDDDAADLLGEMELGAQQRILARLEDPEQRDDVADLLQYDPESAGGLMTAHVATVAGGRTVREALEDIRRQAVELEDFSEAYVVDPADRLLGVLNFKRLVLSPPERLVADVMEPVDVTVPPEMDQEEVARLMARYNVSSIPVVTGGSRLIGRITFDDVTDVVEAEATEDLLRFGGVSPNEELGAGWKEAVRSRLPWLGVNLITAFLAASVVGAFGANVAALPVLAVWMPVIAGMGGNAGTQALAVTVRRIGLGLIPPGQRSRVVRKEVLVGLTNGLANGGVVGLAAVVTGQTPVFGLVVFLAMAGNLVVAGFAGAFIPVLLERFRIDPAVASSVFVTTFTDVCGFALLLGLAGWVLL